MGSNYPGPGGNEGAREEIKGPAWSESTKLNADFILLE